jgi:hypothetical protein
MLYTLIFEFRGGTYIAQVSAHSSLEALKASIEVNDESELRKWSLTRDKLHDFVNAEAPVPISDVEGVWCFSGTIDGHFAFVNIVRTANDDQQVGAPCESSSSARAQ